MKYLRAFFSQYGGSIRLTTRSLAYLIGYSALAGFLVLPFLSSANSSNFTKQISYQAKLTDSAGATVPDGNYNIQFKLYNTLTGGSPIWTGTLIQNDRPSVANGQFSVMLGATSTSLTGIDFNQPLYLSVNIGGTTNTASPTWDGEMTPRKTIGTVPHAFIADTLDGLDSTSFVRADSTSTIATSSTQTVLTINQLGSGDILSLQGSGSAFLTVVNSGNVGIGTTSPYSKLAVVGDTFLSGNLTVATTTNTANFITQNITLSSSYSSILSAIVGSSTGFTNFSGGIGTGGSDSVGGPFNNALRITSSGNLVNIGSIQAGEALLTSGGTFASQVTYTMGTGSFPTSVAIGDINGDGAADLAVVDIVTNSVAIFVNNGNGSFAAKVNYTTGSSPFGIALHDLNGDGKADIVVTNRISSGTVSVFINNGNGTFATKVDYAAGSESQDLAIGDLNGDGKADIAVTNRNDNTISVLLNKGNGTFLAQATYATGSAPYGVALGDVNGDGKADIAVSNRTDGTASVFINNGNGTFASQAVYTAGSFAESVALGDVNGDGKLDMVVANNSSSNVSVFINSGNGTFPATGTTYTTGTNPVSVALADINGDGRLDIETANFGDATISVLSNSGNGTFSSNVNYSAGTNPLGIALGDLNADGKADVAVANGSSENISVFLNQPRTMLYAQASSGFVGIGATSTPGSLFSVNGVTNFTTATSTFYSSGGINLASGCFAVNGICISGGGVGSQTPWLANINGNGFSLFGVNQASTTLLSALNIFSIGRTSTTTIMGDNATSTFAGFIDVNGTGTNATSTFASNLWVKGTLQTGTGSMFLSDLGLQSSDGNIFLNRSGNSFLNGGNFGVGTSSPYAKLSVAGEIVGSAITATSTTATSTFAGNVLFGNGEFSYDAVSGTTTIDNLALGTTLFDTNAGIISWVDMPVSSVAPIGTVESYSAQLGGQDLLTVYGESDGADGIQNSRIGIASSTPGAVLSVVGNFYASTTATSTFQGGGINLITAAGNTGCFAVNGTCIGSGGQTPWTSDIYGGGFSLFNVNQASTTLFSALNGLYIGRTSSSTINGDNGLSLLSSDLLVTGSTTLQNFTSVNSTSTNATSTSLFASLLQASKSIFINATSSSLAVTGNATSTFVNGVNLTSGCFAVNGICISGGGVGSQTPWLANINGNGFSLFGVNQASTTLLSALNIFSIGRTSTTTIVGDNATSTFAGFIDVNGTGTNATSTFASNLWVKGTLQTGTGSMFLSDLGLQSSDGNIFLNRSGNSFLNGGNFGVGTSSPAFRLSIQGNSLISGNLSLASLSGTGTVSAATLNGYNSTIGSLTATSSLIASNTLDVTSTTTMHSGLDMLSHHIVNVASPTGVNDAANKAYVDAFITGLSWKQPVNNIATTSVAVADPSPVSGDRFILYNAGATGFSSCTTPDIAEYNGVSWVCTTPTTGATAFADSYTSQSFTYNGTEWVSLGNSISHNSLTGLQGGTSDEYYHLKASDYNALTSVNAQLIALQTSGSPTFAGINITGNSTLGTITSGIWNGTAIGDAYITKSGNWTGTFDGQEGTYYLDAANLTNFGVPFYNFFHSTTTDALAEGSTNKYWSNTLFDNRLSATTTLPNLTTLLGLTDTITLRATTTNSTSTNLYSSSLVAGNATSTDSFYSPLIAGTNGIFARLTATSSVASQFPYASTTGITSSGSAFFATSGGNVSIGATSTPGSLFSVNGITNFTTATSTFYSSGGINLAGGCFAVNGTCLSGVSQTLNVNQASTTLLSVLNTLYIGRTSTSTINGDSGLSTLSSDLLVTGSTTLQNFTAINATTTNATSTNSFYTALLTATNSILTTISGSNLTFTKASTTQLSVSNQFWAGGTGTTTITSAGWVGVGTSTPGSIFSVNGITNFTTATTTFYSSGGINLAGGCFAVGGTCISGSGGGGSGTVSSGTQGQLPFYDSVGTTLTATTSVFLAQSGNVSIGTSTDPGERLEVVGNIVSKGTLWTSRTSAADNTWRSVTYGNGLFVAVAGAGSGGLVMTSSDGINWTSRSSVGTGWLSVTYANGLFVAVGNSGTGTRVMTSPDGITWTLRTSAADKQWNSVTYGNGLFVAIADTTSGIGNLVMTSPDGITWTSRTSAADNNWGSVTYGNSLFVAVAFSGTGNRVMTSPDGITWTSRTSAADNDWNSVTYANGLFVAVASSGTGNRVMTSPDGITWTSRTSAADNYWTSVTYGNGLFVAVALSGTGNRVMTSPDGITWTSRTSAANNNWINVTYGNGLFVAVSTNGTGNRVMSSGKMDRYDLATNNIYQGGMNIFGNVAIGTSTPTTTPLFANLTLWGASTSANTYAMNVVNSASTTLFTISNGGNVGVGTSTPGSLFSVNGITNFTTATSTFYSSGGINLAGGCFAVGGTCISGSGGGGSGTVSSGTQGQLAFYDSAGTTLTATSSIYLAQSGNFGIGTTSPAYSLDVASTTRTANLLVQNIMVSNSYGSIISAVVGSSTGFTNFSGGIGNNNNLRITSTGNLANIGSVQAGETLLTSGGTFPRKTDYTGATNPRGIAVGDLNGDGKADIVATNDGSASISVFMNRGNGVFAAKVDYTAGTSPENVVIGDLNGDGKPDIAVDNFNSNTISVFMNNGNGTFAAKVDYTTGTGPQALAIGDLNGDGKADLAVVNQSSATVSVFVNNGNGTFASKTDYTTGSLPKNIAIGDLNGDGKADLAVSSFLGNSVGILMNNGNGTFAAKVDYTTGTGPRGVVTGDLNGDGILDLAVTNSSANTLSVLINNGNGTFATKVDYATGSGPDGISIGDVNGDGRLDIAAANSSGSSISVFINNGDGTLAAKADYTATANVLNVAIGDLNNDGKADIAAANNTSNTISVLLNQSTPMFYANAYTGNVGIGTSTATSTPNSSGFQNLFAKLTVWGASTTANTYALNVVDSASTTLFTVRNDGKVGIGTTTPVSTLSVQGSLCVRNTGSCGTTAGNIYASNATVNGIDLAERYQRFDDQMEPGDIVSLSKENVSSSTSPLIESFGIRRADNSRSEKVIGILSTDPGFTLGKEFENASPVALAGRVPVKVNLEGGSISVGDYITLSSMPGIGMKATTSGQTVGVALEPYDGSGPDKITAFVKVGYQQIGSQSSDNSVMQNVISYLTALGAKIEQGIATLKELVAEKITTNILYVKSGLQVGDEATPTAITIFDKQGKAGCLTVDDMVAGVIKIIQGKCGSAPAAEVFPPDSTSSPQATSDTESPIIQLIGDATSSIVVGDSYVDPGAMVTDNVDHNLGVETAGSVDTTQAGEYVLKYNATDSAGNKALELIRTVTVVDPSHI